MKNKSGRMEIKCRKMKILRINCLSELAGGVETYIRETDESLVKRGHQVLTLEINSTGVPGNDRLTEHYFVKGNRISRLFGDLISDSSIFETLMNAHEKLRPDVIHLHHFRVSFMSVAKFIHSVNTPCVYTAHDAQLICPISTLVLPNGNLCEGGIKTRCFFTGCKSGVNLPYEMYRVGVFRRLIKDRISAYVCPSMEMKHYMESFGYEPAFFVRSLPNIDLDRLEKLPLKENHVIGYLGRIEQYKGLQYLLSAISMVKNTIPDIHLNIAGQGPYLSNIMKLTEEFDLSENVTFLGLVPKEEHRNFFANIEFLIIPSVMMENIIFTAQEAFSYGRTVIASAVGGIPEIVNNGINGILCKPADSKAIAKNIQYLLSDRDKLKLLSEKAFKSIHKLIVEADSELNIMGVYNKVIPGARI